MALPVAAQDWQPMTGDQISAILTNKVLVYDGAQQTFFASGRTLYETAEPSWGSWEVRNDQYCSRWPPSDRWDCYDMTKSGNSVQFLDAYGNVSIGTFAE